MRNGTSLTPSLNNWQLDSHKSVTFSPKDSSKLTHTLLLLFLPDYRKDDRTFERYKAPVYVRTV